MRLPVVDCDGHVVEPSAVWEEYAEPAYRGLVIQVRAAGDGDELWIEGRPRARLNPVPACHPGSLGDPGAPAHWADLSPGGRDPVARLAVLDDEGLSGAVLFPSLYLLAGDIEDPAVAAANARAYNNWIADFCAVAPDRLFAFGIAPLQDVGEAVRELERAADLGLRGVTIRPERYRDLAVYSRECEPGRRSDMIRVNRSTVPEPASLSKKRGGRGPFKDMTEAEQVAHLFAAHITAGRPPEEFRFDFARYKDKEVQQALETLFHRKCAYCESRYAATQPLDVEHWRPKAQVHERDANGKKDVRPGYHWLASAWANLFPSCIDCNREREQRDIVTDRDETLGKANQFPVNGPRMTPPAPGSPPTDEDVLLLNPCDHDPAEHLEFHDDGTVLPIPGSRLGSESIRVYALNRSELAFARLGLARLIEQRLHTIEGLTTVIAEPALPDEIRRDLEDLLAHEIDALHALAEPNQPYSALAHQLIDEDAPT